jgi:magnesium-transporting ATPase (P-type)
MMSVVVETPAKQHRILTKGAPESVFGRCTFFELEGELYQMEPILIGDLIELYQDLSMDGFRVLTVAYKDLKSIPTPHPLNMLADAQSVVMRQARTIESSNCEQPAQQRSASLCQLVSAGSRPETNIQEPSPTTR